MSYKSAELYIIIGRHIRIIYLIPLEMIKGKSQLQRSEDLKSQKYKNAVTVNAPQSTPIPPPLLYESSRKFKKIKDRHFSKEPHPFEIEFEFPYSLPEEIQMKIIKEVESNLIRFYFPGWIYGCRLCYGCKMTQRIHLHKDKAVRAGGGFTYHKTDLSSIRNAAFLRKPLNSQEVILELPEKIENEIKKWTLELVEKLNPNNRKEINDKIMAKKVNSVKKQQVPFINKVTFGSELCEIPEISETTYSSSTIVPITKSQKVVLHSKSIIHTIQINPEYTEEHKALYQKFPGSYAPESFKYEIHKKEKNLYENQRGQLLFNPDVRFQERNDGYFSDDTDKEFERELLVYRLQNDLESDDDHVPQSAETHKIENITIKEYEESSENQLIAIDDKEWLSDNFGIDPSDFGVGTKHILNYRQAFKKRIPSFIKLPNIDEKYVEITKSPISTFDSNIGYDEGVDKSSKNGNEPVYAGNDEDFILEERYHIVEDSMVTTNNVENYGDDVLLMDPVSIIVAEDISSMSRQILDSQNIKLRVDIGADFRAEAIREKRQIRTREEDSYDHFLPVISSNTMTTQSYRSEEPLRVLSIVRKKEVSFVRSDSQLSHSEDKSGYDSKEMSFTFETIADSPDLNLNVDVISLKSDSGEEEEEENLKIESLSEKRKKLKTLMKQLKKQLSLRKMVSLKEIPFTTEDLDNMAEPIDFLSKYCIISEHRLPAYKNTFQSVLQGQQIPDVKLSRNSSLDVDTKKKKRQKKKSKNQHKYLSDREKSHLRKDVIHNHINYPLPPGQNYTEMEIEKVQYQISHLLAEREEVKLIYDNAQNELEEEIAEKIREKYPSLVDKLKYSKSNPDLMTNKDIVKKVDSLIRKKISKMSEFTPKWNHLNEIRKRLNQITVKVLNLKTKKQKLRLLNCMEKESEETNEIQMMIKREQSIIYQTVHPDQDKEINIDDLESALQVVNRQLLTKNEFQYIYHILKLPKHQRINMQTFCCIAALSEKVNQLEPFTKNLINKFDFSALDSKMEKAKKLFELMSSKTDSVPNGTVSVKNLIIELKAGSISDKLIANIVQKFDREGKGYVDFMDYLTYIPLFVEIHERIIGDPLGLKNVEIDI